MTINTKKLLLELRQVHYNCSAILMELPLCARQKVAGEKAPSFFPTLFPPFLNVLSSSISFGSVFIISALIYIPVTPKITISASWQPVIIPNVRK